MLAFKPHKGAIFQVAFSPDGAAVATCGASPVLRVSDAATGKLRWEYAPPRLPMIGLGLAYSHDGTKLATVGWAVSTTFDAETGEKLFERPGRGYAIAFTPDGEGVVTGAARPDSHAIRTDLASGRVERVPGMDLFATFNRLRFSPDGRWLAVAGDAEMTLTDARSGRQVASHQLTNLAAGVGALAFNPADGTVVCSDGPKLIVYDPLAGRCVAERKRSKKHIQEGAVTPDGKFLITVSNDTTAVVWETGGWTEVRSFAWDIGPLKSVAVAPDGLRAVCASDRGRVVVWDLDM